MKTIDKLGKIFEQVFEIKLDMSTMSRETSLVQDLGLNSIGMLYLALALEEEFGVSFNNDDLKNLRTVGDVIDHLGGEEN